MKRISMHSHTSYVGHGEGSIEELAREARSQNLSHLAITEHFPLSFRKDPDSFLSMPKEQLDTYCEEVLRVRAEYPDLEILLGCEMDWLGDEEDRTLEERDLSRFDMVLGSVHFIDGWAFDDPEQSKRWESEGPDYIWRRYFEVWCEAVTSDAAFTIMSHPDLCKKFGYRCNFDPTKLYQAAAEAAKESGRIVEVNTSGAFYPCEEMYPAPALLREFFRAGVPCSLGTDAHAPKNIGRGFEEGVRLMYESGYREITVPTTTKDRQTITIE